MNILTIVRKFTLTHSINVYCDPAVWSAAFLAPRLEWGTGPSLHFPRTCRHPSGIRRQAVGNTRSSQAALSSVKSPTQDNVELMDRMDV